MTPDELKAYKQLLENPVVSKTEHTRAKTTLATALEVAHDTHGSWAAAARAFGVSGVYLLTLRHLAGLPCETRVPAP